MSLLGKLGVWGRPPNTLHSQVEAANLIRWRHNGKGYGELRASRICLYPPNCASMLVHLHVPRIVVGLTLRTPGQDNLRT